jgi:EAL domain-containing protein (putative c-di-GMP-specific phosphodiesterase class I)/PAS domain-containing protein
MSPDPDPKSSPQPAEPFIADFSEGLETGLYLALLELLDEGLIITGDEVVLEANSAACRLLERDYREIAGKPLSTLFPSERAFLDARARLFIQGEMRGSLQVALPGGRHRNLRFIAAARLRPGVHALILSPDLIAETYGTPSRTDDLWPRLAAALEQPVIVIDEHRIVVAANAVALRVLGVERNRFTGQAIDTGLTIEWPAIGASPIARMTLHDPDREYLARVLPGPKPGWRVLLLPPATEPALVAPAASSVSRSITTADSPAVEAARRAVEHNQLEIHFQPLIDARDGSIHGGEALLRWKHPEQGLIPFNRFVEVAREGKVLASMGDWILKIACVHAARWPRIQGRLPDITVNIATEQVLRGDLADQVRDILAETGLKPAQLELDIDEQILNEDDARVRPVLEAIDHLGVRIAIDDFGRGSASIPRLKHYPLKAIKLDPALVGEVGRREDSEAIVEAISSMAGVLGLEIFARGVESEAQQAFLSALGCHLQQGPLFGQPMAADAFRELLARNA